MGEKSFIIIAAVMLIAFLIIVLSVMGVIDIGLNLSDIKDDNTEDPDTYGMLGDFTNLHLTDREHHQAISLLTNTTPVFNLHQIFIQGLHMTTYGCDQTTAYGVLSQYEDQYADDGFTSYDTDVKHGTGWTSMTEIWYNDIGLGKGIIVSDGSAIHNMYGYDVVLTTTYGPIIDFYDYVTFLETS